MHDKLKILIDGRLLSNKPTGISRYTIELINSYNTRYGKENVSILLNKDVNLFTENNRIVTSLKPFNLIHYLFFPLFFVNKKFNIFHSSFYSSSWYKFNKIYTITTVHDLMFYKVKNFFSKYYFVNYFSKYYYYLIVKNSLINSNMIISVSTTTQKDVNDIFNNSSIVIPEGVNLLNIESGDYVLPEILKINGYFLYVGNGRIHKNLDLLTSAFKLYKGNKKLVIIGNVNKKLEDNSNIIQYEFVTDTELNTFYKNCSAFIYPSLYEGFGLPILEAIAYKSIVFSSNAGALSEFNFNSLFFFNPNEIVELLYLMNNINNFVFDDNDILKLNTYDWSTNFNIFHNILIEKCKI